MDDPVRQQYEAYPYPARDPADEARRLVTGSPSDLAEVNHYLFAGRRDYARPFRALVAGGGTGDAAVMLGQQLADHGAAGEVVYLDLSAAARQVAEARVRARGLANVSFHCAGIEDLPALGLGSFDYIDCCGVLHHLEDPAAGLAILAAALDPRGGLGLMLYGEYGRTGVYAMQDLLRRLGGGLPLDDRVALARRVMEALPPGNWLRRNPYLGDHKRSDAELVDLFLHPRDRAYTVPQLAALARAAGLEVAALLEPARYDPATYLSDPVLLARLEGLDWLERAAVAEALAGSLKKHVCYLAADPAGRRARADRPEAVPRLRGPPGPALAEALRREPVLPVELDGLRLRLALPPLAPAILGRIDGRRDLGRIHAMVRDENPDLDWLAFAAVFGEIAGALQGVNLLWISYP